MTRDKRIRDCHVYAISAKELERVKIGATDYPVKERMAAIQVGSPCKLEILRHVHASWPDEQRLHELLTRFHITGEWFSLNAESESIIFRFMDALDAKCAEGTELQCRYGSRPSNPRFSALTKAAPPPPLHASTEIVLAANVRCQNPSLACKRLARRYWTRGQSLKLCKPCYRRFERHGDGERLRPWGVMRRKKKANGGRT